MNGVKPADDREVSQRLEAEPLDSMEPSERMRAIDSAMQQYFEAKEWLKERNREFPGLRRR